MKSLKSLRAHGGHHEEETDSEGTWAVSYGDMVTLLLTFFIVFFSIDPKQDSQRQAAALQMSLLEAINKNALAFAPGTGGRAPAMSIGTEDEKGINPDALKNFKGRAHQVGDHLLIEFPGVSFFKSSKTDVTSDGKKALESFVQTYMPYAGRHKVSVRAFTDRRPVKNGHRFEDNLELSALRSVATLRILQKAGIPLSSMKLAGFGEHIVTEKELDSIPDEKRSPASPLDLARKVVLVIEPEGT